MARGFSILEMQSMRADAGVQAADNTTPGTGGAILAVPPVTMWLLSATRTERSVRSPATWRAVRAA